MKKTKKYSKVIIVAFVLFFSVIVYRVYGETVSCYRGGLGVEQTLQNNFVAAEGGKAFPEGTDLELAAVLEQTTQPDVPYLANVLGITPSNLEQIGGTKAGAVRRSLIQFLRKEDPEADAFAYGRKLYAMTDSEVYQEAQNIFQSYPGVLNDLERLYPNTIDEATFLQNIKRLTSEPNFNIDLVNSMTGDKERVIGAGVEGIVFGLSQKTASELGIKTNGANVVIKFFKGREKGDGAAYAMEQLNKMGLAPPVFDAGANFYVVGKVEGPTVAQYLANNPAAKGEIIQKYSDLIGKLADNRILVQDLHLDNVIRTPEGKLQIIDAGHTQYGMSPSEIRQKLLDEEVLKNLFE